MKISVVIPNFNGEKILEKNIPQVLDAVREYSKDSAELIIADDASKDNSLKIIEKLIEKEETIPIILVANKENKGFSGNINSGVKKANGDILILLNTDVIPHRDFLKPLLEHFKDSTVFAVGCMDESIENGQIVLRGCGKGKWKNGFLFHSAASIDNKTTLWASGGSSAFRKSTWDKLGGLTNLYNPFYWEDIDLSYRAWKSGYKVLFEKKSIVRHEHEKGAIKTQVKPLRIQRIAYRNQFFFVWLNITDKNFIVAHIGWLFYYFFRALFTGDRAFLGGFFSAFVKLPTVLQYRIKQKKQFIKSDKEILKLFS